MDMPGKVKCINGFIRAGLLWEKPASWPAKGKSVRSEDIQSPFRKDGITVGTILSVTDMDTHIFAFNVLIP